MAKETALTRARKQEQGVETQKGRLIESERSQTPVVANPTDPRKSLVLLMAAKREHGKTTLLKEIVPKLLRLRTPHWSEVGIWPLSKPPTLWVFDPKVELQHMAVPAPWRVVDCETAQEAGERALTCGSADVVIVEELMTVKPHEFRTLDEAISVSRRGTHGWGPTIIGTTQRPVNMPINFRALADYWMCGRITERSDVKAIGQVAGEEYASNLPYLAQGQWEVVKL